MIAGSNPRTISGWTYVEIRLRYHFMSFIDTNVVGTDTCMSQVKPVCRQTNIHLILFQIRNDAYNNHQVVLLTMLWQNIFKIM